MRLYNPFSYRLNGFKLHGRSKVDVDLPDGAKPKLLHRGVAVYRLCKDHYLYCVGQVIISERAGCNKEVIDEFRDKPRSYTTERMRDALAIGRRILCEVAGPDLLRVTQSAYNKISKDYRGTREDGRRSAFNACIRHAAGLEGWGDHGGTTLLTEGEDFVITDSK